MNPKVLVAFSSKCGSTREVAQAVAEELTSRGFSTEVRQAKEVTSLAGYDAVVMGSAIRFNQWLPDAAAWVRKFQAELTRLPTAFFTVHILNTGDDETSRKTRLAYLDPVRAIVKPGAEAFFAGRIDLKKLTFVERMLAKAIKSPDSDQRDWQAIRAWSQTLFTSIQAIHTG
jgi:menaquinone-dependent protoporphyrinogen oxidase